MRSFLLVASAVGAGLAFGRRYLERGVSAQKNKVIETAAVETRRQIKRHADDFLKKSFRSFAIATAIKLLILATLWGLFHGGVIERPYFIWGVTGILAAFLVRDIWVTWPFVRLGIVELSRYGWHPKRALGEVVAGHVFQQVLTEAQSAPSTRSSKVMLVLAGQSREGIEHDIATSVAAIARDTSWSDLRPFLASAAIKTAALMIIYSVSVFLLMA
ncbi:hypothetical protein [Hyphomonas sp. UBA3601]|uniref:hypothetical protein n=1 Tax=Hyphomonas sp. UBA3601 TaxID=1946626 RepID=UPI0025B9BCB7|nr:hypothetical protein [Hyphomonas sp. UBA3601]